MKKKIGIIIIVLAFLLFGLRRLYTESERIDIIEMNVPEYIIYESEERTFSDHVEIGLEMCGMKHDSYTRDFLNDEYAVVFDSEAYEEKLFDQLPKACVAIYDSEIYVDGTLHEMMRQCGEYFGKEYFGGEERVMVKTEVSLSTNNQGETELLLFMNVDDLNVNTSSSIIGLQIHLVETANGLKVLYMRDYNFGEVYAYNDGYMYTIHERKGKADLFFTHIDENGNFELVFFKHYEAELDENGAYIETDDFYNANVFETMCKRYIERQGLDWEKMILITNCTLAGYGYGYTSEHYYPVWLVKYRSLLRDINIVKTKRVLG